MIIVKRIGTILIALGLLGLLTGMGYLIYSGITLGFNSIPTPAEAEYLTTGKTILMLMIWVVVAGFAVRVLRWANEELK